MSVGCVVFMLFAAIAIFILIKAFKFIVYAFLILFIYLTVRSLFAPKPKINPTQRNPFEEVKHEPIRDVEVTVIEEDAKAKESEN